MGTSRFNLNFAGTDTRSRISHALAALAFCYSLLVLLGWAFRVDFLLRIVPGTVPIHRHTAITFVFLSLALSMAPWDYWLVVNQVPSNGTRREARGA